MNRVRRLLRTTLLAAACAPCPAGANELTLDAAVVAATTDDLSALSLEDLMNIEVTSVGKQRQKVGEAPAAVSVITQDDIRRSGATSVPELLRMVPGVQVAQVDANRWAVGVRGFNDVFQNKLLVVADGRSIYSPIFSGVYWDTQDFMLEDLERIEVIRGPGATLWGANAVNGVINITSKSARDTQGLLLSGHGSNIEQIGGLRYGGQIDDDTYYRVYTKARRTDDFVDAADNDTHDGWDAERGGFRIDRYATAEDTLTLQGELYTARVDATNRFATFAPPFVTQSEVTNDMYGGNLLARWTHVTSPTSDFSIQAYYDGMSREDGGVDLGEQVFDLEAQHRFALTSRQEVIWGAGARYITDRLDSESSFVAFDPDKRDHYVLSAFVQDDMEIVPERLHLILGAKFEQNSRTGFEIQPSVRGVWTPDDRNTVWAAVSRAIRTPSRVEDDIEFAAARFLAPDGTPTEVQYTGNDGVQSEELLAFEVGYRVQASPAVSLDLATFINSYDRLIGSTLGSPAFDAGAVPPRVVIPSNVANTMDATTYGAELAVNWQVNDDWRLAAGYTFIELDVDGDDDSTAFFEGGTPRHQLSVRSYYNVTRDLELNASATYVDNLPVGDVPSYVRVDLGLTWHAKPGLELTVGVRNLLDDRHLEFSDERSQSVGSEIPMSVYGQLRWQF